MISVWKMGVPSVLVNAVVSVRATMKLSKEMDSPAMAEDDQPSVLACVNDQICVDWVDEEYLLGATCETM